MTKITLADLGATSVAYELKHPKSGAPLGVTIDLVGPDSAEFRALAKAQLIKRAAQPENAPIDVEAVMQQSEALLATCVVGWSDDEFFGSAFSRARVLEILRDPKFTWLHVQLDFYTNDRTNFFRADDDQATGVTAK